MSETPLPTPPGPSTPPTSPQRAQHAAHHEERRQRTLSSPEAHQRRVPAVPPAGTTSSVTFNGITYSHLPSNLAERLAALPPLPLTTRQCSTALAGPSTALAGPSTALASAFTLARPSSALAGPSISSYPSLPDNLARQLAALPPLPRPIRQYNRNMPPPPLPPQHSLVGFLYT